MVVGRPNVRWVTISSRPPGPEGCAPGASPESTGSTGDVAAYAIGQPSQSGKRGRFYAATWVKNRQIPSNFVW